jgi:hypothetical protein
MIAANYRLGGYGVVLLLLLLAGQPAAARTREPGRSGGWTTGRSWWRAIARLLRLKPSRSRRA